MPGTDPITAIANALAQAGAAAQPFIEDWIAQKYENEHQQRMAEWLSIVAEKDNARRGDRMHDFVLQLLGRAGAPSGDVANVVVPVPLDTLTSLLAEVSEGIKKDALLARVQFKTN